MGDKIPIHCFDNEEFMNPSVPPSVVYPSPNEWPQTIYPITGITNDSQALITCTDYSFTSDDQGVTSVMFKQVQGMLPINGVVGLIQNVIDSEHFTVNINTTFMPIYRGGGVISILTGQPPLEQAGFQYFNTPFQNTFP
jgi:hypothetical protein